MQQTLKTDKTRTSPPVSVLVAGATVFLSSACVMMLELAGGRLAARQFGASLYTWTSVIGITLGGLTIGSYLGGRIADRFPAKKALSTILAVSSAACSLAAIMNNLAGKWMFLWYLSWPGRVFVHISIVLLLPFALLGTITPLAAKTALERGGPKGATIGQIYAWGAAGSIAGTFLAGFYLIAALGSVSVVWAIGAGLLVAAFAYTPKSPLLYLWAVGFLGLLILGTASYAPAARIGASLALRTQPDPEVLYEDDSQYNHIAVKQVFKNPDKRAFVQDRLVHSMIIMDDIADLQYFYTRVYAALTRGLNKDKQTVSALAIGGGGYVMPRYIVNRWPTARVDVVEIDPAVTTAAMRAFGLHQDARIKTITADARNYIDTLVGNPVNQTKYDFIYEDAFSHYSVPYQLVTKEFNDKITQILGDEGLYMINLIDVYDSGLFLRAVTNTVRQTFPNVYVVCEKRARDVHNTFVVISSKQPIDVPSLLAENGDFPDASYLDAGQLEEVGAKCATTILTDDYAPAENLLAPVVLQDAVDYVLTECGRLAKKLKEQGRYDQSIATFKEMVKIRPDITVYYEIAQLCILQGNLAQAEQSFCQAITYGQQIGANLAGLHFDYGILLKQQGRAQESGEHLRKAIDDLQRRLAKGVAPKETLFQLGVALTEAGDFNEATQTLTQAVAASPADARRREMLARALLLQGRRDEAINYLDDSVRFMSERGLRNEAAQLQRAADNIRSGKSATERR